MGKYDIRLNIIGRLTVRVWGEIGYNIGTVKHQTKRRRDDRARKQSCRNGDLDQPGK